LYSRVAFLVVGAVSLLLAALTTSLAQQADPQAQAAGSDAGVSFSVASVTAAPGQSVPMTISIAGQAGRGFLMIRGLPNRFKLSSGFSSGDAWLVSLSQLGDLQLAVPGDFEGHFDLAVLLVLADSKQTLTRSASVTVLPQPRPKDRLAGLEKPRQTQARSAPRIALPERRPLAQLRPVDSGVALPPAKLAAAPPMMALEHETHMMNLAAERPKEDDMDAARPSDEQLAAVELPRPADPDAMPSADNARRGRDVAEFCDGQRKICRKVCALRFRNDFIGCPQACESRQTRCVKTGCYRWPERDFLIAKNFGGYECAPASSAALTR
jgi:hypothetical protein